MVPIHLVGVQTWLQSSHEGKGRWLPRGGSFIVMLLDANLHNFAPFFGNTDRDGLYTLGKCTYNIAPLFGNTDRYGSYILGRYTNLAAERP